MGYPEFRIGTDGFIPLIGALAKEGRGPLARKIGAPGRLESSGRAGLRFEPGHQQIKNAPDLFLIS